MALDFSKTGRGAFQIHVADDKTVTVHIGERGMVGRKFPTAQEAYDFYYRPGDHAAWNVCYFLEDVIADIWPDGPQDEASA